MANFDDDIRRITEEVLSDGTIDKIIREKVVKGFESAIADSFRWGELEKTIKARVTEVLVPFIEGYDMSEYIVKLDHILTDIVNQTALVDNKTILEGFRFMMIEPPEKEISISELFKEYKKFVGRKMETCGREVIYEPEHPEYEPMEVGFTFEEEDKKPWNSFSYATLEFSVEDEDQENELNRTIRCSRWNNEKKPGWELRFDCTPTITSLRNIDEFDLLLVKLQRAGVRLIVDAQYDEDEVFSDTKPEPTYE